MKRVYLLIFFTEVYFVAAGKVKLSFKISILQGDINYGQNHKNKKFIVSKINGYNL